MRRELAQGIIDNETLGYFIARIYLFLTRIGIDATRLRFRQHMANEMAHYAADCWDAEIQSSYGWIECVGCADRSAYDLTVHAAKTGKRLVVEESLAAPVTTERWRPEFNRKTFGSHFKKDAKVVEDTILAQDDARLECMASELQNGCAVSCTARN
jgi:glycyl-tRNA synthetase